MKTLNIDINADVGEGVITEADFMPYLSSCSIACGGHVGDHITIENSLLLAKKHGVKVGAHPSFPDTENFGRKLIDISFNDLEQSIIEQLELFKHVLAKVELPLNHIKAHGALYNICAKDPLYAGLFLDACSTVFSEFTVYLPFKSVIEDMALERGISFKNEAFGDRGYSSDGSLIPRNQAGATLEKPLDILMQIESIANEKRVRLSNGNYIEMEASTFCIHGDNPRASEILHYINTAIAQNTNLGIE